MQGTLPSKLRQARHTLGFAGQLLGSGDYAAALEQVRGALSLTARWWLLAHDVFPLARAELPAQLHKLNQPTLARALDATIHDSPDPESLAASLKAARAALSGR